MGAGIAAQARRNCAAVLWCPAGRGEATARRAADAGLTAVPSVADLVERADVILSIGPPAIAEAVAVELGAHDLAGRIVVEANPVTTQQLASILRSLSGATVLDGAIIGSVPGDGKRPALYLSGPPEAAAVLQAVFAETDVQVRDLGPDVGQASALKLAYSTFQKGSRVLAALAQALADDHGVGLELVSLAKQRQGSYLSEPEYVAETAALAWRWSPELAAAAAELSAAGLPGEAIQALSAVLDRWHDTRDDWKSPHEAVESLRRPS
jgi:3-hydroxyisobutyrate dehydrogenase-like beta-hydroxyacid dehydrogenase